MRVRMYVYARFTLQSSYMCCGICHAKNKAKARFDRHTHENLLFSLNARLGIPFQSLWHVKNVSNVSTIEAIVALR